MATSTSWSFDDTKKLIDSFKKAEVLWRINHTDYGKRGPRFKALKRISSEFEGKDIKEISNKWSKLRTTYMRRRKRKSAQKSGSGALEDGEEANDGSENEDIPCETDAMTFLDPYLTVQRSVSNLESELNESILSIPDDVSINASEGVEFSETGPSSPPIGKKKKRSAAAKEEDNSLLALSSAIRHVADSQKQEKPCENLVNNGDEFDVYGKHVANELRSMESAYSRDLAKKRISDILFDLKWSRAGNSQSVQCGNRNGNDMWVQPQNQFQAPSHPSTTTMCTAASSNGQYNSFSHNEQRPIDNSVGTNLNQQLLPSSWVSTYGAYDNNLLGDQTYNSYTQM